MGQERGQTLKTKEKQKTRTFRDERILKPLTLLCFLHSSFLSSSSPLFPTSSLEFSLIFSSYLLWCSGTGNCRQKIEEYLPHIKPRNSMKDARATDRKKKKTKKPPTSASTTTTPLCDFLHEPVSFHIHGFQIHPACNM